MTDAELEAEIDARLRDVPPPPCRILPDGRILELIPLIFNVRLTVTLPENAGICWDDGWCYHSNNVIQALIAFATWNGEGEPEGWNKHPTSGRYRKDGTPASEINKHDEPAPSARQGAP